MARCFALATAAALSFSLAATVTQAEPKGDRCEKCMRNSNGAILNGVILNGVILNGIALDGIAPQDTRSPDLRRTADVEKPTVKAVILPSGETIDLRQPARSERPRAARVQ